MEVVETGDPPGGHIGPGDYPDDRVEFVWSKPGPAPPFRNHDREQAGRIHVLDEVVIQSAVHLHLTCQFADPRYEVPGHGRHRRPRHRAVSTREPIYDRHMISSG